VQNKVVNAAITTLNNLVGNTSVSTQITNAIANKSDTTHTHNYAGSSSAGGAATSANKINTNAGSATQPVYFANGIPVKTTYTLEASVPSNAKFTDTTYSAATTSAAGLMSSADKTKLDGIATGANKTTLSSLGLTATAAELNYVDGVTSNIQTQLNNKAPKYTCGTTDLTAGSSTLAAGTLYFYYITT
jgi:molybdopterin-biosynthesis enzyme MoeA-like protein